MHWSRSVGIGYAPRALAESFQGGGASFPTATECVVVSRSAYSSYSCDVAATDGSLDFDEILPCILKNLHLEDGTGTVVEHRGDVPWQMLLETVQSMPWPSLKPKTHAQHNRCEGSVLLGCSQIVPDMIWNLSRFITKFLQGQGTDPRAVEVMRKSVGTGSDATVC